MAKKKRPTVIDPITHEETTLTPELIKQAASLFRSGITETALAGLIGIRPAVLREWLVRGGTFNQGLHGLLFRECYKSLSSVEIEHLNNIRIHALGAKAEYAYDEIIHPDGRVEKKIARNPDGDPIIAKHEIKPNPTWSSWILSKRFRTQYGGVEEPTRTFIDEVSHAAAFNEPEGGPVDEKLVNEEQKLKMMELYIRERKALGSNKS